MNVAVTQPTMSVSEVNVSIMEQTERKRGRDTPTTRLCRLTHNKEEGKTLGFSLQLQEEGSKISGQPEKDFGDGHSL